MKKDISFGAKDFFLKNLIERETGGEPLYEQQRVYQYLLPKQVDPLQNNYL